MESGALFHINESSPEKQRAALRNIRNLMTEMPELRTELTIQGDAINLVVASETSWKEELRELQQRGLLVTVCRNTLQGKNVAEDALLPDLTIVPSAVGRIVLRQQEGFAYVKP